MRHLFSWLALLVGFAVALSALPGRAADKADEATINKWIGKLSSGRFAEREKAQKELDKIGLPALEALRKAAEKGDPETRRRAADLIAKLEKHALAAKVLAPKKLHLTFKDTPVKEAVAQFARKSGYNISLHDPENKFKDRKITLDTGVTTFWQAFDQFCAKAGLTEATQQDLQGVPVPIQPPGGIRPPRGILPVNPPAKPAPLPPLRIQPVPPPQKLAPLPPQKQVRAEQARLQFVVALKDEAKPVQAPAVKGKAVAVPAQIQVQPAPAIQILPAQQIQIQPGVRWRGGPMRPWPMIQPGQIILKDGKEKALPTAYSGAVRIRVLDNPAQVVGPAPQGEILLGLQVSLEPKIRWEQLVNVRIDKALDDQGQTLMPGMGDTPGVPPGGVGFGGRVGGGFAPQPMIWNRGFGGYGNVHQIVPVRLRKGEKAAKSLKELSGAITAAVLAEPETLITADNILKAAGKTFKGKDGGSIKVNAVEENGGQLRLRVELVQPANAVPANQGAVGGIGVGGAWNGPVILPVAPPAPPVPAPPAKPLLPKGAFQVQGKAVQVQAAPAQVQVQIQIGGGGAVQIGGPGFMGGGNAGGLVLLDDKGNVIPTVGSGMMGRGGPGGVTWEHQLMFQLQKGQKAASLVFKGSKRVNIEIPFSFKNVTWK
jgi:hypothetical protein